MDKTAQAGDAFRAESYGLDAVRWIKAHKALATKVDRGQRISEFSVKAAATEAQLAARSAARFANRMLGDVE